MAELQQREDDNSLSLDENSNPIPLEGAELDKAARAFADAHDLKIESVEESAVAKFAEELGGVPEGESAREYSIREREESGIDSIEPANEPEDMVEAPAEVVAEQTGDES
jgi:hypothetical protein